LPSWQKSAREGKSTVLPSLTNQALMRLIWQAVHGLGGSAELISASLRRYWLIAILATISLLRQKYHFCLAYKSSTYVPGFNSWLLPFTCRRQCPFHPTILSNC